MRYNIYSPNSAAYGYLEKRPIPMQVRLKDIARDLGLSIVTISKVLRDHPDISRETRERVPKRVRELNYHPNLAARALITGQSFTLA
jgi:LacI family transcriptional regulator